MTTSCTKGWAFLASLVPHPAARIRAPPPGGRVGGPAAVQVKQREQEEHHRLLGGGTEAVDLVFAFTPPRPTTPKAPPRTAP
ncbi:hypothetical protein [Streptomyces sp. YIM 98790]|uniref:hypothetical protein n=1 Tax=Streptomyces sp. YIM 98790 TaxID=2689077 RepID=UPI00140C5634|nr:hypothetical protein [Streptomyces sp. YIM 98790]